VIRVCIALEEALRNALFHGNLELTSEQREGDTDVYQELVEHRTRREPYASRKLHVTVDVTPHSGRFMIRDEGPGFDPKKLPDPTDPENLERVSGRGLLLMRTFMDDVAFNATGNEVTMLKRCQAVGAAKEVPLMPESQHVRTEQQGDVLVVWPLFTFATFTQPDVSSEWTDVQNQLEAPAVKHVVVDLSQIPYFGSTVLEWMVQMWKRIKDKGGRLATCNPSPIGREVLTAARFDKLWGVFDTREEALKWLAGGKGKSANVE
jgi:anti-anti-sigma factor